MKSINEAIMVEARKGVPCRFRWEDRLYRTRKLLDYWILQTRWWGREERRIYFRLLTDRGVMEVYRTEVFERAAAEKRTGRKESDEHLQPGEHVRSRERPPLPIEGDTHTRERRRTDAVYRPDIRAGEGVRGGRSNPVIEARWALSKIVD